MTRHECDKTTRVQAMYNTTLCQPRDGPRHCDVRERRGGGHTWAMAPPVAELVKGGTNDSMFVASPLQAIATASATAVACAFSAVEMDCAVATAVHSTLEPMVPVSRTKPDTSSSAASSSSVTNRSTSKVARPKPL